MHLYVGNLAPAVTEGDLRLIFDGVGEVVFAQLPAIRDSRARGYAYVAVTDSSQAQLVVDALHGRYLKGTMLVVEAVAERARVGAKRPHDLPCLTSATMASSRRTQAAALGLYLVKSENR